MKLTDVKCRTQKPGDKAIKLADGGGLYLEVMPNGSKFWRQKYRYKGKEKRLSHGKYPLISLSEARDKRDEAKKLISDGHDPAMEKQLAKATATENRDNTFESIAREWHAHKQDEWTEKYATTIMNRLEADIFPSIGKLPIREVNAPILIKMLKDIESRGVYELTRRASQYCSQILRYAVMYGKAERDFTYDIRGALKSRKVKHHAAIDSRELPELIKALNANDARMYKPTKLAVELMMLTFVRTSELIHMRWEEIDWAGEEWIIPKERMKMGKPHIVPLASRSLEILTEMQRINGNREFVFTSHVKPKQPMSNNTILKALERMGYKGRMTGHGFRALALTTLQEKLGYPFEVADCQLAHAKKHSLGAAYDRAQFIDQRRVMMQDWSDYITSLDT